jgi:cell division protein ZapA (FtsZ GTPase activity inhibitor)
MEDREVVINLIIDGVSYPLTVPVSEEPYYRKAGRIVEEKLSTYKNFWGGEGGTRVVTMVALDIAYELATQRDEVGSAEVLHKINELARLIDGTLEKK